MNFIQSKKGQQREENLTSLLTSFYYKNGQNITKKCKHKNRQNEHEETLKSLRL